MPTLNKSLFFLFVVVTNSNILAVIIPSNDPNHATINFSSLIGRNSVLKKTVNKHRKKEYECPAYYHILILFRQFFYVS